MPAARFPSVPTFLCLCGLVIAQPVTTPELPGPPAPSDRQPDCSPAELKRGGEIYREISEESGGFFFDGGIGGLSDDAFEMMLDDAPRIAWKRDSVAADKSSMTEVIVDSAVRYVDFVLNNSTCDNIEMSVFRPDGQRIEDAKPGVKITGRNGLRRVRVEQPPAGTWKVVVQGSGRFQLVARAKSNIEFDTIHFDRLVVGLKEPVGQDVGKELLLNEEVYFEAWLFGDVTGLEFELITPDGKVLEKMPVPPESYEQRGGTFTPRKTYDKFLVRARGKDANGAEFSRVASTVFTVRSLVVREDSTRWAKPEKPYRFQIQNAGKPDRLSLRAETSSKLPLHLSRESVEIGAGSMEFVDIELEMPRESLPSHETIMLVATSNLNPGTEAIGLMKVGPSEK